MIELLFVTEITEILAAMQATRFYDNGMNAYIGGLEKVFLFAFHGW